jgi:three-Cys-motif partner protein
LLWPRDPHTEAKHAILKRYLQAWWPILLQTAWVKRLTFLDGFAGPGEYEPTDEQTKGPEGSPCIALRTMLERSDMIKGRPITFIFIEQMPKRHRHLEQLLKARFPDLPPSVYVRIECAAFEDAAEGLLTNASSWRSPIFANLDTWGI